MGNVKRIIVEKKQGFNIEAENLLYDLKHNLLINNIKNVRILNIYDIEGISDEDFKKSIKTVFSEPQADTVYIENLDFDKKDFVFGVRYLPGQFDQRADSAAQCLQILTQKEKPLVKNIRLYIFKGKLKEDEKNRIKDYLINPVDSEEAELKKPKTLKIDFKEPEDVKIVNNFIKMNETELKSLLNELELAMSFDDLRFCQDYFKKQDRNPTITEIKLLDTYWSDHCRHTTFNTIIEDVKFSKDKEIIPVKEAYSEFLESFKRVYLGKKELSLMRIATINMKEMLKTGKLYDLELSDEVNACSIIRDVETDEGNKQYLIMFKNETHNHPTEIEPFGGAATCLGGAIRDPLSGRAYVYQAMRVTGSGNPNKSIKETIKGKLPQNKITKEAALGYSSYGNQIGLATGLVSEIYHDNYVAKRMEVGAVVGSVEKRFVRREKPVKGDIILLIGGRTGRDGIGGATGSSKEHSEESIKKAGAEVQKGNPPEERKLQRLFRNYEVIKMIKKSNDFGAGGVSVAIGELADGLDIYLDNIPKKYEGLDGTELALSESQERMAVVIEKKDFSRFKKFCEKENLEVSYIADVTDKNRLRMFWRNKEIVNISREFLNTNGVEQKTNVFVKSYSKENYFEKKQKAISKEFKGNVSNLLNDLNIGSQKGLVEMFDSSIGAGTVLMPFGGRYQLTPIDSMVSKVSTHDYNSKTVTIMSYGFNPDISMFNPFYSALYSVVESVSKIVATGGNYKTIRLSLQEYFEKLGKKPEKWGKPFSALLGAYKAMKEFEIPAVGGKDSMSGTFNDINVPPTLISFAITTENVDNIISPELKSDNSVLIVLNSKKDSYGLPDFDELRKNYSFIYKLVKENKILSMKAIKRGGVFEALMLMSFGNKIGVKISDKLEQRDLFFPDYGSILIEMKEDENIEKLFENFNYSIIGKTITEEKIVFGEQKFSLEELIDNWRKPLNDVFKDSISLNNDKSLNINYKTKPISSKVKISKPRVLIPVFPGTNCEYDTEIAFKTAGAEVNTIVFRNLNSQDIRDSIGALRKEIENSQIIMLSGGFSAGDEPDGSGKFIASVFRNPEIKDAVMDFLYKKDGLMLGICNGFQALIKLGLVPYGEIRELDVKDPTLTFNSIGRHISKIIRTKIVSNLSPWFSLSDLGEVHTLPISHGEGRFVAGEEIMNELIKNGQVATQYVDFNGEPSNEYEFNPNGSLNSVEAITNKDGRILGKMAHSERIGYGLYKNIDGNYNQRLFESGVFYFS